MQRIVEGSLIDQFYKKDVMDTYPRLCKIATSDEVIPETVPMNLEQLGGMFAVLGVGLFISLIAFCFEKFLPVNK